MVFDDQPLEVVHPQSLLLLVLRLKDIKREHEADTESGHLDADSKGLKRSEVSRTWTTCCCLGMVWSDTRKHMGSFRFSTSRRLQHCRWRNTQRDKREDSSTVG